jgi:L-threonylcarbamoyladenylate synthase
MIRAQTQLVKLSDAGALPAGEAARLGAAAKSCKSVAFPTDTVYGVGSTGLVKAAARRIYQIKGRPTLKPLPILVESVQAAKKWVEWTPAAELLARAFWPGALTLILKPTAEGRLLTFAEYQTVAIRVPAHDALKEIIAASGVPWVSTSANVSGSPALTDGEAVVKQFTGLVDYIVDGGAAPGVESTIADATQVPVRVLREGAIPTDKILEALKQSV